MSNISETIDAYLKEQASKATIGISTIRKYVNSKLNQSMSETDVINACTAAGYLREKQSLINPHHQTSGKQPAKHSSKTKAQTL
jgi:hypothetical protein